MSTEAECATLTTRLDAISERMDEIIAEQLALRNWLYKYGGIGFLSLILGDKVLPLLDKV